MIGQTVMLFYGEGVLCGMKICGKWCWYCCWVLS